MRGRGYGWSRWSGQELRHIPYLVLTPVVAPGTACVQVVAFGGNMAAGGAGANDAIIDLAQCVTVVEAA